MTYSTFPPLHEAQQFLRFHPTMITEEFIESFYTLYHKDFHNFNVPFSITMGNTSLTIYVNNGVYVGHWFRNDIHNTLHIENIDGATYILECISYFNVMSLEFYEALFIWINDNREILKNFKKYLHYHLKYPGMRLSIDNRSLYHESKSKLSEVTYLQMTIENKILRIDTTMKYNDVIAELYYNKRLDEMARYVKDEVNPLHNSANSRFYTANAAKLDPIETKLSDTVRMHKGVGDDETSYTTVDYKNPNFPQAIHSTIIQKHKAGDRLPFEHETQEVVEKVDHPDLPKLYATNLLYNHFLNSDVPLSSSNQQQMGGNKMWQHIAHRAFEDGHHVYLWNNLDNTLNHLDTKEKVDSGLNHYFSANQKRTTDFGHIIIAKNKLQ